MLNDFSDDEVEKLLGEFRVNVCPVRQIFEPGDLGGLAGRIGRGKVVFGFEFPHSLCMFEALTEGVDQDRVQTIDAFAVLFENFRSTRHSVSHCPNPSKRTGVRPT
jgi:hypothetical protein